MLLAGALCLTQSARLFQAGTDENLGYYHLNAGDADGAIAHFDRVPAIHPRAAAARRNSGWVHYRRNIGGDLAVALDLYREAARLSPLDGNIRIETGLTLAALGDFDAALTSYQLAVKLSPDSIFAHEQVLATALRLDRQGAALAAAKGLIRLDPKEPKRWFQLAERFREARQFAAAERVLKKAAHATSVARKPKK